MNTLFVIDTETGGLDPDRDSVVSVAAVVWRDRELVAEIELFVNEPELNISPKSISIHGLEPSWLRLNGLSPDSALVKLEDFIRHHFPEIENGGLVQLAGHNVAFDVAFKTTLSLGWRGLS